MRNVKPGDPVQFTAHQINEWNKTAEAYRAGKFQSPKNIPANSQNPVVISIQNKTGEFAGIFSVLALGESVNLVGTDIGKAMPDGINKDVTFEGNKPSGDETVCITLDAANPDTLVSAVITGAVGCVVDVASTGHRYAVPVSGDVKRLRSSESGVIRILNPLTQAGEQFCYVLLGGGGEGAAPPSELATIVEPLRRPLFRNIPPDPFANADTPEGNTARCMGTIALPGKTYRPIQVGIDDLGNPIYLKRREPRTGSGRFVLRWTGHTHEPILWIFADGADFPNHALSDVNTGDFLRFFLHPVNMPYVMQHWVEEFPDTTTTDPELAQYDYDYAVCYNLDWSELLIEGDKVEYQQRTTTIEIDEQEITFTYYEVQPLKEFNVQIEGQADVVLQIVTPEWDNPNQLGTPIFFSIDEADPQHPEPPEPPGYEAVFLKLKDDLCTPELVNTIGICNDCTSLRVRGCFIREDRQGRRYPMLFELPTLRAGGAIRSRQVSCYYKTEHDECSPVGFQPEMKLIRTNDWRLALSPTVCAISCTALVDALAKPIAPPKPPGPNGDP